MCLSWWCAYLFAYRTGKWSLISSGHLFRCFLTPGVYWQTWSWPTWCRYKQTLTQCIGVRSLYQNDCNIRGHSCDLQEPDCKQPSSPYVNTDLCAAEFFQTVVAAVTLFVPIRTADTRGQRQQETRAETKQCLWRSWPRCPCLNQELPPSEAPLDLWPLSSVSESLLSLYPVTFTATVQSVAQLKQLQEPFVRRDSPSRWGWRLHVTLTAWWSLIV